MAMNTLLTSIKIHRQRNDGYTYITHQIILIILTCQETRRIVTKLHLEIVCSICQNQRWENGVGMSYHVPIIGRISSSKSFTSSK